MRRRCAALLVAGVIGWGVAWSIAAPRLLAAEVVDLVIVAGQSNAVGYDAKPSELPAADVDRDILFWWRCGDPPPDDHDSSGGRKWTHLQAQPLGMPRTDKQIARQYGNFAQRDGGFGPEMGLGRTLRSRPGNRLAIIKVAFSGTSLQGDWHPSDPGARGACYRALVDETRAAIESAHGQGLTLRIRALAWVQGESDANATAAPRYADDLTAWVARLRHDLEAPEMIALFAVNTRFGGEKQQYMPQIVAAQQAAAERDPRAEYVDTATAEIANSAHYNSAGTLDVGRRFAEALWKVEARLAGAER